MVEINKKNNDNKINVAQVSKIKGNNIGDFNEYKLFCQLGEYTKNILNVYNPLNDISKIIGIENIIKNNMNPLLNGINNIAFKTINISNNLIINKITPLIGEVTQTALKSVDINNSIVKIIEKMDISNIIEDLVKSLPSINEIFKDFDFSSTTSISGLDTLMLKKYYWVIPFEYDNSKLQNLSKYKTRTSFEKYMLNYFNASRTKRMISKINKQFPGKDKKVLIKQIENSLNNGDYAICITSLITMLDGMTLQLLEPNSDKQHLSYKAINDMLDYMDKCPPNQYSYELYLRVEILNNFYLRLYKNINNIKVANIRSLSRHINTHGVRYLNKKIEVLRLLNAIYYCQKIIEETQLQNRFTRTKQDNKFLVVSNNKN